MWLLASRFVSVDLQFTLTGSLPWSLCMLNRWKLLDFGAFKKGEYWHDVKKKKKNTDKSSSAVFMKMNVPGIFTVNQKKVTRKYILKVSKIADNYYCLHSCGRKIEVINLDNHFRWYLSDSESPVIFISHRYDRVTCLLISKVLL